MALTSALGIWALQLSWKVPRNNPQGTEAGDSIIMEDDKYEFEKIQLKTQQEVDVGT